MEGSVCGEAKEPESPLSMQQSSALNGFVMGFSKCNQRRGHYSEKQVSYFSSECSLIPLQTNELETRLFTSHVSVTLF